MATLENIRKRGILIAIIIGLALAAFILGDFLTGGSAGGGQDMEIAEIDGNSVSVQEYEALFNTMVENTKRNSRASSLEQRQIDQIRDQAWEKLLSTSIMADEYNKLGLTVSKAEFEDMVLGNNIDPQIRQAFTDPQTGQFNAAQVQNFIANLDEQPADVRANWISFEQSLKEQKIITKYNTLLKKGLYTTKSECEAEVINKNKKVSFNYVVKRYTQISDSAVTISDEDLETYYDEHKSDYDKDASRTLEYMVFEIKPSDEDNAKALDEISKLKAEYETTLEAEQFVNLNSDVSYIDINYKKEDLEKEIDSIIFAADTGFVYGPYFSDTDNAYILAKLLQKDQLPDSVQARHILITTSGEKAKTVEQAQAVADSIQTLINNGSDFAELAQTLSDDQGSATKGGDLGMFAEGQMVKPFSDFCFSGKIGDIGTVESQFGIHLIEKTGQTEDIDKVKIGFVKINLNPSQKTIQDIYNTASQFANKTSLETFDEDGATLGLSKRVSNNLKENDKYIAGIESPRPMVRWAFKAETGDVSEIYEFGKTFVVAVVSTISEEGIASLDEVKADIQAKVINDKKAESIISEFDGKSINDLTAQGLTLEQAADITFSAHALPNVGVEPEVIASAITMKQDEVSQPIKGKNGVFIIQVTQVTESDQNIDPAIEKQFLSRSLQQRVDYQAYEALKKNANIVDGRSKFY